MVLLSGKDDAAAELFGRERELAAISALAARAAVPDALLLVGEPGMGKTTLWRHGQEAARQERLPARPSHDHRWPLRERD